MQDATVNKTIQLTKEGFEDLQEELSELQTIKLPAVIERVAKAREYGDLSENAEYHSAREDQNLIETRIDDIEVILATAQIVKQTKSTDKIGMGSQATLKMLSGKKKEITFTISGEFEGTPGEGKISSVSPLGKVLMGKKKGDKVKVQAPMGEIEYEIISVK
ncbi:MAG: transcription elongation factor GreA [bacterium]|nr:transcription elongation factor GreA [bacterium]